MAGGKGGGGGGVTGAGSHMTTELPDGLQTFFKVTLGMTWPEGSEGGLKAMSQAWLDFQDSVGLRAGEIESLIPRLNQAMQGVTADALAGYLQEVGTGLREVESAAGEFAKMTKTAAADIQKAKIMLIAMAAMVLATVIALLASLFGAFAVPGTIAAGRIALGEIWKALVRKMMQLTWQKAAEFAAKLAWTMGKYAAGGAAFMGGLDLSIQGFQIAFDGKDGVSGRDEVDWESIKGSVIGGAIGGAAFGAFHGIGKGIAGLGKNVKPPGWVRGVGQIGYAGGQIGTVAASNPFVNMATGNDDEIWAGILGGASAYHGSRGLSAKVDNAVGNFTKDIAGKFGMKFDTPDVPVDPEQQSLLGSDPDSDTSSITTLDEDTSSLFDAPLTVADGPLETTTGYSGTGHPVTSGSERIGSLFTGGKEDTGTTLDGGSRQGAPVTESRGSEVRDGGGETTSRGVDGEGVRGIGGGADLSNGQGTGQLGNPVSTVQESATGNPQGVRSGPQGVQSGPESTAQPVTQQSGPLGVQSGPQGVQSGPQGVQTGPQSTAQPVTQQSAPQSTTQSGQPVTQSGQPITQSGQPITQSGQPVTQSGQPITQSGQSTTQSGQPVTQSGQPVTQSGQPVTQSGQPITQSGQPVTQSGQPITQSGQPVTQSGQSTTQSGQSTTQSGQSTTQSGQPSTQSGQSGQSSTQGQPGAKQGAPVVTQSGQPSSIAGGPSLLDTPNPELGIPALADNLGNPVADAPTRDVSDPKQSDPALTDSRTPRTEGRPHLTIDTSLATTTRDADPVSPLTEADRGHTFTGPVSPISPVTPAPQSGFQSGPAGQPAQPTSVPPRVETTGQPSAAPSRTETPAQQNTHTGPPRAETPSPRLDKAVQERLNAVAERFAERSLVDRMSERPLTQSSERPAPVTPERPAPSTSDRPATTSDRSSASTDKSAERPATSTDRPVPEKAAPAKPAERPVTTTSSSTTTDRPSADKPTVDKPTVDKPAEKPADKPTEKPTDKPADKPAVDKSQPAKPTPKPATPEDLAAALAAVTQLAPESVTPNGAPTPKPTPLRPDATWNQRRDSATPTRYGAERFEPNSRKGGLHVADGQVSGRITQIRYDVRHFEVAPGKWVVEFAVPLDLVSPDGSVDANARRGMAEELQSELDRHFNHRYTWPGGGQFKDSQIHFTVEAATPNGVTPGWDADTSLNVPVEVRDSGPVDNPDAVPVDQVRWDAAAPVGSRLHEYFHFLGLGEGYADDAMMTRPSGGRDTIMGDTSRRDLSPEQLARIAAVHGESRPVLSHSLTDSAPARPAPNPADPGPLLAGISADGPYSAQHAPVNAPTKPDPKNPPPFSDLPAVKAAGERPSRQAGRDAKLDQDPLDESSVPTPGRDAPAEDVPVKGWTLDEANEWFTTTAEKYFSSLPGREGVVPFLSGGAALSLQGGVRRPKDLDFRLTATDAGFMNFNEPGGRRFLKHLNESALRTLHNDYRTRLGNDEVPAGGKIDQFAPLSKAGVGSTSMGSLNILGQEISLTIVPNDAPATVRLGDDGSGPRTTVLPPKELVADKLRTMVSRTKSDQDSVKKVAQDVFDTLDAMEVFDRQNGRDLTPQDSTVEHVHTGLAERASEYSQTNLDGVKLQHWSPDALHELMTARAVLTAEAHVRNGPRREAFQKLLDDVRAWGGDAHAERLQARLEAFAGMDISPRARKELRPWMHQWNDAAQFGPGPEARGSGRPKARWGAAPGEDPATGPESVFPSPDVEKLLDIDARDITAKVDEALRAGDPTVRSTEDAAQIVRVLAFSGGFRPLLNSTVDAQTIAAFDLTKNRFGKAYDRLHRAGLVEPSPEGLRLRKAGWDLVPTSGPFRVHDLDGLPISPKDSPVPSRTGSPAPASTHESASSSESAESSRPPSPSRPSTPVEMAEIELAAREADAALSQESDLVRQGLRERARTTLFSAGWSRPFPAESFQRALDIVAHTLLTADPATVRETAQYLTAFRHQDTGSGPAGDGVRLAEDGAIARPDGTSTGTLPPGAALPKELRAQWEQARTVTEGSKLPPEMADWISSWAHQLISDRLPGPDPTLAPSSADRDLISRRQALATIVGAQILTDRTAGLDLRQTDANARGLVNDLLRQLGDGTAEPVAVERSFDFGPRSTRLDGEQRAALDSLAAELAEANTKRAADGYLPPTISVSGQYADVIADALATRGIDADTGPGRPGGADVRVDWDLKRPADHVPPDAPASTKVADTVITSDRPQAKHPVLDEQAWRHSTAPSAPWFDPAPNAVPALLIEAQAMTQPVSGHVRGEQGGVYSNSKVAPGKRDLGTWRGPIAYDIRRFDVGGVPVQNHTVSLFLNENGATPAQVQAIKDKAKAGVDELFNKGNRMASGRQFHVTVDFTTDRSAAHAVVDLAKSGRTTQLNWPVGITPRKLGHEIGHFLGLHDEYAETGPNKPVFQDKPGASRVTSDSGPMTRNHADPDAALKPRNLWLIENHQKALESTATPSAPDGDFPSPPPAPQTGLTPVPEGSATDNLEMAPLRERPAETTPSAPPVASVPTGPITAPIVRAHIPDYVADNLGAGPSVQKSAVKGMDLAGSVAQSVPALRGHPMLKRIQAEVTADVLSFVGENKRPPYRIVDGKNVYELHPRARLRWDQVKVVDPDAEAGAVKSTTDNKTISTAKSASARDGSINAQAAYSAAPPLVVAVKFGVPAAPTTIQETTGQLKTNQSTESETTGMHKVEVPVELTYSVVDADGTPLGQITIDPSAPADRSVSGTVELDVPLGFARPDPAATPIRVRDLPSAPTVEELHSTPTRGNTFYDQTAKSLPKSLTEIRSTGRPDLMEFLSDNNIKANWHKMAVTEQQLAANPDAGWVRSKPLVKGPESGSWSNKASMVEMRAVARRVQVIETLPDAKSTVHRFTKDTLTKNDVSSRGVDGTLTVIAGGDLGGAVYAGVGPAGSVSAGKSHAMEHSDKSLNKTSITTKDDAVRYRTEHVLQVRTLGGEIRTLDGDIVTYQSTPYDKAADAGLVPPRTTDPAPATPDPSGSTPSSSATPDGATPDTRAADAPHRYPPAHIVSGHSIGGAIVDDFRGGDALYRAVADILRTLPGHKWYHLNRSAYVVEFGDVKLSSSYSRGLKSGIEKLLGRGEQLKKDLSGEHLSELVNTMLTDRGLSFTVKPKNSTTQDYVTTVTLKATMDEVRSLSGPADHTHTSDTTVKHGSKLADEREVKIDGGIRSRVWHPFTNAGHSNNGMLNATKSKAWTHTDELTGKSSESVKRTHGDSVGEDGTVGDQTMWPFGARLTITPEVQSYVRTGPVLRAISIGKPGRSVPALVEVKGADAVAPQQVALRLLVPEALTTDTAPEAARKVARTDVRLMDHVPRPNELGRKAPRSLDDLDVVAVLGTDHIGNAVDERVFAASGDPVDALGADGKAKFPRGGTRADDAQLTPDGIARSGRPFEPIELNRGWERRRHDLSVDAAVVLTPKNPEPVTALEYQSIEKTYGAGGGIGKGDKSASSVGVELGDTVVPVGAAGGGGTVVRFRSLVGATVSPVDVRWGEGGKRSLGSSVETTVKGAAPVKETLVWVDLDTDVVAEAKYQGNLDKAEWFDGAKPGRAGTSFTLPKSMLVWATDEQIAAMRGESTDSARPIGPPVEDAPVSVVGGKGVSLGLGAVTTVIDARDRMSHLHAKLSRSLGEAAADSLLPKSRHDAKHDNHSMVSGFLSDVHRAAGIALNGGQIAPLRHELGRWKGKTYFLTVGASFVEPPRYRGVEHVDKLATADSLSTSESSSTASGHTVGSADVLFRPGVGLSDRPDPAAAGQRTGHGPGTGFVQTGGNLGGSLSRTDNERTASVAQSHKQSEETSGPMAAYRGAIQLDLRIERAYELDAEGRESAGEVVARDSAAIRDVTLLKLPEESFPAPKGELFGEHGPESGPPATRVSPDQLADWRTRPGHVGLLEPGADKTGDGVAYERGAFVAEHYFGDLGAFRERAELAVRRAGGGDLDSRAIADIKAALTLPAVKAGLPEMMRGRFTVPLKDFDLEVHARLPQEQRLSSVSAAVEIGSKADAQYKDTYTAKSGHSVGASTLPIGGGGGAGHPDGANSLTEGRQAFGSHFGSTQASSVPIGAHESVLAGEPYRSRPKDKAGWQPPTSADLGKITQVDLHDVEFRFVARPKKSAPPGVADLPVTDAFAIRHRPDAARPLPEALTQAATALADAAKAWTAAEKALATQELQQGKGKKAADTTIADKRDAAESAYHDARLAYDAQIVAARVEKPLTDLAATAERFADTAAREAARAEQSVAAAARADAEATAATREGRTAAATEARARRAEHQSAARDAAGAAREAATKAADTAARITDESRHQAIKDARAEARRHADRVAALNAPSSGFLLESMRAAARLGVDAVHRADDAATRAADSARTVSHTPAPAVPAPRATPGGFWSESADIAGPSHQVSGTGAGPFDGSGPRRSDDTPNRVSRGGFADDDAADAYVHEHYKPVLSVNKANFEASTPGHRTNCAAAAIQTIRTVATGTAHEAGPSAPVRTEDVEQAVGARFQKVDDFAMVDRVMSRPDMPVGGQALLFLNQDNGEGHYISVHKKPEADGGFSIVYLDGQSGRLADLGTAPSEIGLMRLPASVHPDPVYALPSTQPDGGAARSAAGPFDGLSEALFGPPAGGVIAGSNLPAPQRVQLGRHGAVVVAAGGVTPKANFLDAVKRSLDQNAPAEHRRITGKLAEAGKDKAPFSPDAIAEHAGLRVHVLDRNGAWSAHGPVWGKPVHIVETELANVARYAATKEVWQLGKPGLVYPGPSKTLDGPGDVPHVEHRGEFEVETIAGQHYVRIYTAVYDAADPGADRKDVHQNAGDGTVTLQTGKQAGLWMGGGRPLRAVQWVSKYQNQQLTERADDARNAKDTAKYDGFTPVLRSYLVPLAVYTEATEAGRAEHVADDNTPQMVDPSGEVNQFGMRGDSLKAMQKHVLPGSLVTYVPASGPALAKPELAGRVESITDLYSRLGLHPDFDSTALGHENDPWFKWKREDDGQHSLVGFNNDVGRLDDLAHALMDAHQLWLRDSRWNWWWNSKDENWKSTSPFYSRTEIGPGESEKTRRLDRGDAERLNQFVNKHTPASRNLDKVADVLRQQMISAGRSATSGPLNAEASQVRTAIGRAINDVLKDKDSRQDIQAPLKTEPGPSAGRGAVPANPAALKTLVEQGTPDGRTFRDAVVVPMATVIADKVFAGDKLALLDEASRSGALRTSFLHSVEALLTAKFAEQADRPDTGTADPGWKAPSKFSELLGSTLRELATSKDFLGEIKAAAPKIDPAAVQAVLGDSVLNAVRKETVDKVASKKLIDVKPSQLREIFSTEIGASVKDVVKQKVNDTKSGLGMLRAADRAALAESVATTVDQHVRDAIKSADLTTVPRSEVDPVMRTTVPEFATMAAIGALNARDAARNKIDYDVRESTAAPYPNDYANWRVKHFDGYTQKSDPAEFEVHRVVGNRLRDTIADELANPDQESAYRIVETLISQLDESRTGIADPISKKFSETVKPDTHGHARYRAPGSTRESLFHEHAQMVLNQFIALSRNDDDAQRFVSRDALVKAILFHDMDKVNSKNLYGDTKAAHDAEPEHRGAVTAMNRHEGLWANAREFRLARAIVDADPIGLYLRDSHSAQVAYDFIQKLAHQAGRADGQRVTAVDVMKFFEEFEQYYQADFSSYTDRAHYVDPNNPGAGPVAFHNALSGLRRDAQNDLQFAAGNRRYEYSDAPRAGTPPKPSYHAKMEDLRAMFAQDVFDEARLRWMDGVGGVSGIGGSAPTVFQGRGRLGEILRFGRDKVVETVMGHPDGGRGIAFDRLERLRELAERGGYYVPRPAVVRPDEDDRIDLASLESALWPADVPVPPSFDEIVIAAHMEGERFVVPVETDDGTEDVLVRPPAFAQLVASSPPFQRMYDQAAAPSMRLASPYGGDLGQAQSALADALGGLGYPLQPPNTPTAPPDATGSEDDGAWWSDDPAPWQPPADAIAGSPGSPLAPASSDPAALDPAAFAPAGTDPAGSDPAGTDPHGSDPTGHDADPARPNLTDLDPAEIAKHLDATDPRDLYALLGLPPTATDAEIRAAFDRLAHLMHPSQFPGDPRAEDRYRKIVDAFAALSHPESRAAYDAYLRTGAPWPPAHLSGLFAHPGGVPATGWDQPWQPRTPLTHTQPEQLAHHRRDHPGHVTGLRAPLEHQQPPSGPEPVAHRPPSDPGPFGAPPFSPQGGQQNQGRDNRRQQQAPRTPWGQQ